MTNLSDKPVFKVTLHDLGVAPENIRADDDVDSEIDELANTLMVGQISPLLVRKGGENCLKDWLILDGRRRFLAFEILWQDGRIDSDFQIDCILCEAPEEIAAALVVANATRLEITKADYLLAVNRLMGEFKTPEEIGRILGIEVAAVRQVAKLGSLDRAFLQAFKEDRLSLKGLKTIARVKDPEKISNLLEELADDGELEDYQLPDDSYGMLNVKTKLLQFFSIDDYVAAGGQVESDLFQELPDRLLNPAIAHALWETATLPIARALENMGLQVHHASHSAGAPPNTIEIDWQYNGESTYPERQDANNAINSFKPAIDAALEAGDTAAYIAALTQQALKRLTAAEIEAKPLEPLACVVTFNQHSDVQVKFFADQAAYAAYQKTKKGTAESSPTIRNSIVNRLDLPNAKTRVTAESYGTLLHQRVTSIAGKTLARNLADNPTAALDAQISAQFQQCLLHSYNSDHTTNLLKVSVSRIISIERISDDDIRRPIVERLKDYRTEYQASGLYPFEWVQTLPLPAKLDLLALITALQVDTYEGKNNELRLDARAEAAHIARAIDHDPRDYYTPDAAFYGECSKKQLLQFLADMGEDTAPYQKTKRPDLAETVATLAAKRNFIPPAFIFELEPADDEPQTTLDNTQDDDDDQGAATFDDEEVGENEGLPA